ncbi:MAG: POTRA domain-containing protein [Candidatus Sulfotelmatobacter sp.]
MEIDLRKRARALDPEHCTKPLAQLYSEVLVEDGEVGPTRNIFGNPFRNAELAAQIRSEVQTSNDIEVVGMVAFDVVEQAVRKAGGHEGGSWDFAVLRTIATELVTHAEALDPQDQHVPDVMGGSDGRWSDLMEGVKGLPGVAVQSSSSRAAKISQATQDSRPATPRVLRIRQGVAAGAPQATQSSESKFNVAALTFEAAHTSLVDQNQIAASITQRTYSYSNLAGARDEVLERIRAAYQDHGYFKVVVRGDAKVLASGPDSTRIAVTARVDEGQQYRLGGITFKNNQAISDSQVLRRLFPLKEDDIFSREKIATG